jgi:hypothetical protein
MYFTYVKQPAKSNFAAVAFNNVKNIVYTLVAKFFNILEIVQPRPQAASATIFSLGTLKNDFAASIFLIFALHPSICVLHCVLHFVFVISHSFDVNTFIAKQYIFDIFQFLVITFSIYSFITFLHWNLHQKKL